VHVGGGDRRPHAGVRVHTVGLEKIDPSRNYIFMSNHISNLDPPITLPLIPRRTSVMVKKELFSYPILGKIMLIGSLVPVDRGNAMPGSPRARSCQGNPAGLNMTIYIEGKRSFDGRLLPFKKGPFYLAEECKVPVVPITISGTQEVMRRRARDSAWYSHRAISRPINRKISAIGLPHGKGAMCD